MLRLARHTIGTKKLPWTNHTGLALQLWSPKAGFGTFEKAFGLQRIFGIQIMGICPGLSFAQTGDITADFVDHRGPQDIPGLLLEEHN